MSKTIRKTLREELTARFVPALRQRGFNGPDRISGNGLLHEFRRSRGGVVHVLSLQFDKYQRPRFILNVHVEPPEGLEPVMARGGTVVSGRAAPGRGGGAGSWFRADRPWWQRLVGISSTREQEAVSAAIAMLEEIEHWWDVQAPSEHIRTWPTTYRSPHESGRA